VLAVEPIAGVLRASQDYDSGLTIWSTSVGPGQLVGCTYAVEATVGHPVTDLLLRNLDRHLGAPAPVLAAGGAR
jgi:hypothetical protein